MKKRPVCAGRLLLPNIKRGKGSYGHTPHAARSTARSLESTVPLPLKSGARWCATAGIERAVEDLEEIITTVHVAIRLGDDAVVGRFTEDAAREIHESDVIPAVEGDEVVERSPDAAGDRLVGPLVGNCVWRAVGGPLDGVGDGVAVGKGNRRKVNLDGEGSGINTGKPTTDCRGVDLVSGGCIATEVQEERFTPVLVNDR